MNILFIILLAVLVVCAVFGYRKGLLGIVYKALSWIFIVIFVIALNPWIYSFIVNKTSLQSYLDEKIGSYIYKEVVPEVPLFSFDGDTDKVVEDNKEEDKTNAIQDFLTSKGIALPDSLASDFVDGVSSSVDGIMNTVTESANKQVEEMEIRVVNSISNTVSSYIIKGIAFFVAFVLAKIICFIVGKLVKGLQKIPVLHGIFSWLGLLVGVIEGMLIVWLFMYIVSLCASTGFGEMCLSQIKDSTILLYLYQHNLIVAFVSVVT